MKGAASGIKMGYRKHFWRIARGEQEIKGEATSQNSTGPVC